MPLDTLENYVTKCFADVPNNGLPPDDFTEFTGVKPFDTPAFHRVHFMKTCAAHFTVCIDEFDELSGTNEVETRMNERSSRGRFDVKKF